ncbi:MAG: M56 family metallopeptidase [Bacteroidota bacterium]
MFDVLFDAAWAQALAAWLATYALHSTVLLGAAWLASRWITSALTLDALWKTAVLAGFVTASVQVTLVQTPASHAATAWDSSSSDSPSLESSSEREIVVLLPEHLPTLERLDNGAVVWDPVPQARSLVIESESFAPPALLREPRPERTVWTMPDLALPLSAQRWAWVLVGFWLLGFAIEGLRRARTHRRFVGSLGDRVPVRNAHLRAEVERLGLRAGLRYPLRLTQSDSLAVPVALGVDEVVLPTWAVEGTRPAEQRALLAHEVAHLARRDPFWLAVFALVESIAFFQPLNHLARRCRQAAAERLCDAWAAEQASPLAMARCLVDAAGRLRAHHLSGESSALPHLVPGMAAGHGASLSDRVEHLIDGNEAESKRRWPVLLLACAVIVAVASLGPAVTSTAQTPPAPPEPPVAGAMAPSPTVPATPPATEAPPAPISLVVASAPADSVPTSTAMSVTALAPTAPAPGGAMLGDAVSSVAAHGTAALGLSSPAAAVLPAARVGLIAPSVATSPTMPTVPAASSAPDSNQVVTYTRNEDNRRVHIKREGRATFADDGRLVALSEGGRLLIEEEVPRFERRYEARTRSDGSLVEVYEVNGDVQPLDESGLRWIRERLEESRGIRPPPPPPPPPPHGIGVNGHRHNERAVQPDTFERDFAVYRARIETYASQQTEALREAYQRAQAQYEQRRQAVQGQAASSDEAARAIEELSRELEGQVRELDLGAYTLDGDIAELAEQLQRLADVRGEVDYAEVRDQLEASLAQLESFADASQGTGVRLSAEQLQQRAFEFEQEAQRLREAAADLRLDAEDLDAEENDAEDNDDAP